MTGSQKVNGLDETGCQIRSRSGLFVGLILNYSKGPPFSFNQVVFKYLSVNLSERKFISTSEAIHLQFSLKIYLFSLVLSTVTNSD